MKRNVMAACLALLAVSVAHASKEAKPFAIAADEFLSTELPLMDSAVQADDSKYFGEAYARMMALISQYGAKIETAPRCADAVIAMIVAGICRTPTPDKQCEDPAFLPRFASNVEQCKQAANAVAPEGPR